MQRFFTQRRLSLLIIFSVLLIDQIIKIWVKTSMYLYEKIHVADWFYIYFVENNGMAFGMEIVEKSFLSIFRIIAVIGIAWILHKMVRTPQRYPTGVIVCLSLILSGAVGNILDSVFYGELFTASTPDTLATTVAWGEGYSSILHGKVVDMFYFPIIDTFLPHWLPIWGGEHFIFFSPIFNFADAAISCGMIALILFYGKSLHRKEEDTPA